MNQTKKAFCRAGCVLLAFFVWLLLVLKADVRAIGPMNSYVGLAGLNGWFHNLTGVHMGIYNVTDIIEWLPVLVGLGFAFLGLVQLIRRRNLWKVDADVLVLGVLFITVGLVFALFEFVHINYRPVLIDGKLESSFPSSTTMLVMTVAPALSVAFRYRMKNKKAAQAIGIALWSFMLIVVILRAVSGVHWISDIIGGGLMSAALVLFYVAGLKKFAG